MLIDTHAHLDYPEFAGDFAEMLARAEAADVREIISIGTSVESSRRAVELAEKHPSVFAVIGVHPTNFEEAGGDAIAQLRELAKSPRVVGIGETGLDYHCLPSAENAGAFRDGAEMLNTETTEEISGAVADGAYKSAQATLFAQQLDLAAELGLNVVVHQRDAWEDTLAILKNHTGRLRAVFHCFGGSAAQAEEIIALGHMVSFTGIVTFKNAPLVHECAARVDARHFMVETDCPYLAPAPFRGKRCEPAHTRIVAERIAALRGQSFSEVAEQTTQNARAFFRFDRR